MDEKKLKAKLSGKSINDLKGFEEILDMVPSFKEKRPKKNDPSKAGNVHEVMTFLDNEKDRLKAMEDLFTKKIENIRENEQITTLLQYQTINRDNTLEALTKKISPLESTFQRSLSEFFDSVFKK